MSTQQRPLDRLTNLGQSIWLDYIRRDLLTTGKLQRMIEKDGLCGMTSNPSIFEKAIAESNLYDQFIAQELTAADSPLSDQDLFYRLAIADVQQACDAFAPVYQASHHHDGFVSLEVSPDLARDTKGTIYEAKSLWNRVNRTNLMIKVPATQEGLPAIRTLLEAGLNINVTLLFSTDRYREVLDTYLEALEARLQAGNRLEDINSVASFFVSRLDVKINQMLEKNEVPDALALRGQAAVANAKMAYQHFQEILDTPRWRKLAASGATPQRLLWASTSTKNPTYPILLYVEPLIGSYTVNTLPPATYQKLLEGIPEQAAITEGLNEAQALLHNLSRFGINLKQVTDTLEEEGVAAFSRDFHILLTQIAVHRQKIGK